MNEQIVYWNGPGADRWVAEQASLDAMLQPFSVAVLDAAQIAVGERVLDVGCGCGGTSLALSDRVGPSGTVLGVDVSEPMLARAKERGQGRANLSFRLGDAGTEELGEARFDVLFSRFGVMFFDDPTATFTHLCTALRPGARLAFVCWRPLADNPWARLPFDAVVPILGRPEPAGPDAPGPFSFGDVLRVLRILEGAGFTEVQLRPFEGDNTFGSGTDEEAAEEIARLGPVARLLVGKDEATRRLAIEAMKPLVRQHRSAAGVVTFQATAWIVTAKNPRP